MPYRILPGCTTPGCPERSVKKGKCEACLPESHKAYDQQRGSSSARGYDYTWQRFAAYLKGKPELALCRPCQDAGLTVPRTQFDHVVPLSEGGPRLDENNIQPLCDACHNAKTARETRGRGAVGKFFP